MFRIGDFSILAQLSVKTLHHYDELGLLKPDWIDPETGYRYYGAGQFSRVTRIRALKELGLSLDEIGGVLSQKTSTGQYTALLEQKRDETAVRIGEEQARLARIESQLRQTATPPLERLRFPINLKAQEPWQAICWREVLLVGEGQPPVEQLIARRFDQLYGELLTERIRLTGPPMVLWHAQNWEKQIDIELAIPGNRKLPHRPYRALPMAPQVASVIYRNTLEKSELEQALEALSRWAVSEGYQLLGPKRDLVLHFDLDAGERVVEIQFPVEKK
jgi:DNA-binding transcriptional MerR regulator